MREYFGNIWDDLAKNKGAGRTMKKAVNLDTVFPVVNADAELLLIAHLPDESIQRIRKTIEITRLVANLARAYAGSNQKVHAAKLLSPLRTINWPRRIPKNNSLAESLKKRSDRGSPFVAQIAMIYTTLGDKTQAITWLEKATKCGSIQESSNGHVLMRYALIRVFRILRAASACLRVR